MGATPYACSGKGSLLLMMNSTNFVRCDEWRSVVRRRGLDFVGHQVSVQRIVMDGQQWSRGGRTLNSRCVR